MSDLLEAARRGYEWMCRFRTPNDQERAVLRGDIRRVKDAIAAAEGGEVWTPTHMHRGGGLYRELMRGRLEWTLDACVVYDNAGGQVWVRPAIEFDDGRFTPLTPQEQEPGDG